ncbi:MAG: hypothetical protein MZV63_69340 [Marinilabiliales bacterium]|nr:hypothetical protein [Marinilabiliales bacterium]
MILSADHIIDMGPGAGVHGGMVVAEGSPAAYSRKRTPLLQQYLNGTQTDRCSRKQRGRATASILTITGADRQ